LVGTVACVKPRMRLPHVAAARRCAMIEAGFAAAQPPRLCV